MDSVVIVMLMAFVANGAYMVMLDGMILGFLGKLMDRLPIWLHKPTHTCPFCMVSVYGIPLWFLLSDFPIYMLPIHLIAACGAVGIMQRSE